MKRVISLLMVMCLILSTVSVTALAEDNESTKTGISDFSYVTFGTYTQRLVDKHSDEFDELWNLRGSDNKSRTILTNGLKYWYNGGESFYEIEPIEWKIIGQSAGYYELLSNKVLEAKPFTDTVMSGKDGSHWFDGSLRDWLNGEFLRSAFSEDEQKDIADTTHTTEYRTYDMVFGSEKSKASLNQSSTEKVYLPSKEFCEGRSARENIAYATQYVAKSGKATSYWTLNDEVWVPAETKHNYVNTSGEIKEYWRTWDLGVRPVIRVRKDSKYLNLVPDVIKYRPVGSANSISEYELIRAYPKYLQNDMILKSLSNKLSGQMKEVLATRGNDDGGYFGNSRDAVAALKSQFENPLLAAQTLSDCLIDKSADLVGLDYATTEEKLCEELAMAVLEEMTQLDGGLSEIKEIVKSLDPAVKAIEKSLSGAKEWEDNKLAKELYQSIDHNSFPTFDYQTAYNLVKTTKESSNIQKLSDVLAAAGYGADLYEIISFLILEFCTGRMLVERLCNAISSSNSDVEENKIYIGLQRIRNNMDNKTEAVIEDITQKASEELVKELEKEGVKSLLGFFIPNAGPCYTIATIFYYAIGKTIKSSTIAETKEAWVSVEMTQELRSGVSTNITQFIISKGKDNVELIHSGNETKTIERDVAHKNFEALFSAYMASLKIAHDKVFSLSEADRNKGSELKEAIKLMEKTYQIFDMCGISYKTYIDSCIDNAMTEITGKPSHMTSTIALSDDSSGNKDSGVGGKVLYNVPARMEHYDVTGINAGSIRKDATCIYIPNTVTEIGDNAFSGYDNLVAVYGGENLQTVGSKAFANCKNLEYVHLSRTVKSLAKDAFTGTKGVVVETEEGSYAEKELETIKNVDTSRTPKAVKSIKITKNPDIANTSIAFDAPIDLSGIELQVTYMDGTKETVTDTSKMGCLMYSRNVGKNYVNIEYGGVIDTWAAQFSVTLEDGPFTYYVRYEDEKGNQVAEPASGESTFGTKQIQLPVPQLENYEVDRSTITAKGGTHNVFVVRYKDNKKNVNSLNVKYNSEISSLDSSALNIVLKDGNKLLEEGKDYVLDRDFALTNGNHVVALIGQNKYTGAIPLDVVVKGVKEDNTRKFSDVPDGKWFTDAVYFCRDKGYMAGKGNNKFDPNGTVTRATITQVLYAMEGKPSGIRSYGFKDVASGRWYTDSVNWAASVGIVAGYSKEKFGPNDPITRQQMAAIMYQYAKYKKYDTKASGDISKFKDVGSVTKYAVEPMKWAVGQSIISGTNVGLEPKGTATRAQIAVILQAFDKNIKSK